MNQTSNLCFVLLALASFHCGNGVPSEQIPNPEETDNSAKAVVTDPSAPVETLIWLGQLSKEEMDETRPYFTGEPNELTPPKSMDRISQIAQQVQKQEMADPEHFYLIKVELNTGNIFAISMDHKATRDWASSVAPLGVAPSSDKNSIPSDAMIEKSWSGSTDNRILRDSSVYDTDPVLSKIGLLPLCTGTMFSREHVFTAAHCVLNSSGVGLSLNFAPRQRGAVKPYGSSWADSIIVPSAWMSKQCYGPNKPSDCPIYDFAILHFPPTFSPNPGYVAFGYLTDTDLSTAYNSTAGYPGCGYAASPAGCSYPNQYQDSFCNLTHPVAYGGSTSNSWPYSDGTNPMIAYGCDVNEGDSGSGIFRNSDKLLFANAANNYGGCYTNCTTYGGTGSRISYDLFSYMLTLRNLAP